jgi:hypothetical protein
MNNIKLILLLFLVVLLVSCQSIASPLIIKRIPEDSIYNLDASQIIRIFFSNFMNSETINNSTIKVENSKNQQILSLINYNETSREISIQPQVTEEGIVKITLSTALEDIYGNNFKGETFTINYPEWIYLKDSPNELLLETYKWESFHINGDGTPFIAYLNESTSDCFHCIKVMQYVDNDWKIIGSEISGSLSNTKSAVTYIHLNSDSQKNLYVSWVEQNVLSGSSSFRMSKYENGLWSYLPPINDSLDPSKKFNLFNASSYVTSQGEVFVAYIGVTDSLVRFKKLTNGIWTNLGNETINPEDQFNNTSDHPNDVSICLKGGEPVVIWQNDTSHVIKLKSWQNSTWTSLDFNLHSVNAINDHPKLACSKQGLIVSWIEKPFNQLKNRVVMKKWQNGIWEDSKVISNTQGSAHYSDVFFTTDETPITVFWENENNKEKIKVRSYEDLSEDVLDTSILNFSPFYVENLKQNYLSNENKVYLVSYNYFLDKKLSSFKVVRSNFPLKNRSK